LDLAEQIVDAVNAELPFGIYHATNSGQGSWFDFAQEIFSLCGSEVELGRVVPTDSASFIRPAKRPAYSVLGHNSWNLVGTSRLKVPAMRDWKTALREVMPSIIEAVHHDVKGPL
jgi:dTDP-4-dehydrorhamnose reductase